jgi:hypothetical protein
MCRILGFRRNPTLASICHVAGSTQCIWSGPGEHLAHARHSLAAGGPGRLHAYEVYRYRIQAQEVGGSKVPTSTAAEKQKIETPETKKRRTVAPG